MCTESRLDLNMLLLVNVMWKEIPSGLITLTMDLSVTAFQKYSGLYSKYRLWPEILLIIAKNVQTIISPNKYFIKSRNRVLRSSGSIIYLFSPANFNTLKFIPHQIWQKKKGLYTSAWTKGYRSLEVVKSIISKEHSQVMRRHYP